DGVVNAEQLRDGVLERDGVDLAREDPERVGDAGERGNAPEEKVDRDRYAVDGRVLLPEFEDALAMPILRRLDRDVADGRHAPARRYAQLDGADVEDAMLPTA